MFNQKLTSAELLLVKALTKMPEDYEGYIIDKKTGEHKIKLDGTTQKKAIPAHVKLASRLLEKGIDLFPGSKIQYIVIKDKPILAISKEEYDKGQGIFKTKSKKINLKVIRIRSKKRKIRRERLEAKPKVDDKLAGYKDKINKMMNQRMKQDIIEKMIKIKNRDNQGIKMGT